MTKTEKQIKKEARAELVKDATNELKIWISDSKELKGESAEILCGFVDGECVIRLIEVLIEND